jgi:cytochrome c-type biogenesis protein CcmF
MYQNEPIKMDKYTITYLNDTTEGPNTYVKVNYKVYDKQGKVSEEFNLYPNVQINPKMGLIASPDTKHYLFHDVYTHLSSIAPPEENHDHEGHTDEENYLDPSTHEVNIGDTVRYKTGFIVVKGINKDAKIKDISLNQNDIAVGMALEVNTPDGKYDAEPIYLLKAGQQPVDFGKNVDQAGLKLRFTKIDPAKKTLELMVYQKKPEEKKWIVLKAIVFPYINLFWAGSIIMVVGFLLSIFRRNKELKTA